MRQRLTNGTVFDGEAVHEGRDVLLDGAVIAGLSEPAGEPGDEEAVIDLGGHLLAPGLIDLQVNGGGGVLFNDDPSVAALETIASAHRRFGSTTLFPTLISSERDVMHRAIAAVSDALAGGVPGIAGIHFEGPFLNADFAGVHDRATLRALDDEAFGVLTSLASGRTIVTLAPENVASATVSRLRQAGVIVCGGHSAADWEQTRAALDAGMTGFTHLFNAMPPFLSRAPGMVGAALDDSGSFVGLIADGFHLHPATLRIAIAAKARGKAVLVTDAMPPVGSDSATFSLNGEMVRAIDGRCLTADGALAGGAIGLIDAVRNAAAFGGVDRYEALCMASVHAARAVGLQDELGCIRPGYRANLIELDASFTVVRSWIDGDPVAYSQRHG